jgi:hypothetical protein
MDGGEMAMVDVIDLLIGIILMSLLVGGDED